MHIPVSYFSKNSPAIDQIASNIAMIKAGQLTHRGRGVWLISRPDKITQGPDNNSPKAAPCRVPPSLYARQASRAIISGGATAKAPSKAVKENAEVRAATWLSLAANPAKKITLPIMAKTPARVPMTAAALSARRPLRRFAAESLAAMGLSVLVTNKGLAVFGEKTKPAAAEMHGQSFALYGTE